MMKEPLLWNRHEAAHALSISVRLLDQLTKQGEIPSEKLGGRRLYPVDAIREWLRRRREGK